MRASRPTITPFDAVGSADLSNAAAPATNAADADVPLIVAVPPPGASATMPSPGAARNASAPKLLNVDRLSLPSVVETPTTFASPAGYVTADDPSLPVAATTTAPFDHAYSIASCRLWL